MASHAPAESTRLDERLKELGRHVEAWTREAVEAAIRPPAERFGAMLEYHMGWRGEDLQPLANPAGSGKKLRATIALLVCEAACGSVEPARPAAVALELTHNFSLVHDDIQDRSLTRRHRPTLWTLWGEAQAINAGDALFAIAQLAIARAGQSVGEMAEELNQACLRLVEGQYLDLELQDSSGAASLELYEAMVARKTGALFECACRLGAIAGQASPGAIEAFGVYGLELGIAFQEQDDLLGVWGDERVTGKSAASDVATRKRGLPAVLALARADVPDWLRAAYRGSDDLTPDQQQRVVDQFEKMGVREAVALRVQERTERARKALARAGAAGPACSHLALICESMVGRRA